MDNQITQHFRKEEQELIESFSSSLQEALYQNRPILTNFLNPREQHILQTLVNRFPELKVYFNGGFSEAENKRALITPDYFVPAEDDFSVRIFEINYPINFTDLEHRQILGTLVNAGIKRSTFGDIVHQAERWQFAVNGELENFFLNEIDRIGKIKVKLIPTSTNDILKVQDDWEPVNQTVASLRMDSIISTGFSISRHRVKELIEKRLVQLNWMIDEKADTLIALNDVISVRKYGRIKLIDILGKTKKDKLKIQLDIIKTR
ncbi:RNA-binding protein [Pediococcus pentosaceus]|uniref:YlmH family RNA-binding protein n=1 Tax=Pediococcus pentosaceus TaxID=1255 RepID=UPI000258B053|nr:YlmH/Sll1252 family protein [Pediococcus pentosaceus]CCG90169.1 S4 domain protein [Pediococcus pentosaceus IE-3]